tara:strand:- start:285 stop:644 length:360 start_codon:yes stop_codon:yes gene_type:complete
MPKRIFMLMGMLLMTGCLFTVDSDTHTQSVRWSDQEVARIVRGQTSANWVRSSFGEPTRSTEFDDGASLWHYSNRSKVETEVGLFLLFHIDVEREVERQLSIEIKDGVVRDYWTQESRY